MELWAEIVLIPLAGAIGGLVNAVLVDGGFKKGYTDTLPNGQKIWRPGWLGNVFIGSIAGFIMWVFYGSLHASDGREFLRQIVGAIISGAGGGRIITAEVDKRILTASTDYLAQALRGKRKPDGN